MRERLFAIIAKLREQDLKRCNAMADLLADCAENGEMWEVEIFVEVFHA